MPQKATTQVIVRRQKQKMFLIGATGVNLSVEKTAPIWMAIENGPRDKQQKIHMTDLSSTQKE